MGRPKGSKNKPKAALTSLVEQSIAKPRTRRTKAAVEAARKAATRAVVPERATATKREIKAKVAYLKGEDRPEKPVKKRSGKKPALPKLKTVESVFEALPEGETLLKFGGYVLNKYDQHNIELMRVMGPSGELVRVGFYSLGGALSYIAEMLCFRVVRAKKASKEDIEGLDAVIRVQTLLSDFEAFLSSKFLVRKV